MIISVGSGSMVLQGAAEKTLKIIGGTLYIPNFFPNTDANSVVSGTDEADTLTNSGANSTLLGGGGNDVIENSASNVTIRGGAGNDLISLGGSSQLLAYASGDGYDTVTGFTGLDSIRITDGSGYTSLVNGNDVIISVGSGSMVLNDAEDASINIVGGHFYIPNVFPNKQHSKRHR